MADIFHNLSPEGMLRLIDGQIEKIDTVGTDDVARLRRDLQDNPDDPSQWFDYALALNQAAMHRDILLEERAKLLAPNTDDADAPVVTPAEKHPEIDPDGSLPLLEASLKAFDHVLEMEPEYYGVQTQRGIVYGNMHRYPEAVECFLQALKDDDEDFSAAYYLGLTYRDMGNEELARKYLALAHDLNPDDDSLTNAQGESVER